MRLGEGDGRYYLYGMPASLYTAKARSYLRSRRIDYVERFVGHPRYQQEIMPLLGRLIMPVLETPDGTIVQDTVDIIDYLESAEPGPSAYPSSPRQRIVAHVLEAFGGEGLLRPAMHYRWNFDDENLPFISQDFAGALIAGGGPEARTAAFQMASDRMRQAAAIFGVTVESAPTIEASYLEFLQLFADHLETTPHLLGGRPCIGDFSFMGPLYPHLARDPVPARLMKREAWRVWRWVERMNAPVLDTGEYGEVSEDYFADDEVPETLRKLLAYIAAEWVDEIVAQTVEMDAWLADHDVEEGEVVGGKPYRRQLGSATFPWRGLQLSTGIFPYRMYVLQRLQDAYEALGAAERESVDELLGPLGLSKLTTLRARRRVERVDNREVWGAEQLPVL